MKENITEVNSSEVSLSEATGDSKPIVTNQPGIHEKLEQVVKKHLTHKFEKPFQAHTLEVFKQIDAEVKAFNGPVILDACCGVGLSTRNLAKQNPEALVIGVDKSAHRIDRNVEEHLPQELVGLSNVRLLRADLNDFYRLVEQANWSIAQHYILYPNPWPKAKHLQRRWHGSAVFNSIINIKAPLILRSNWRLYLEEFQLAADIAGRKGIITDVSEQAKTYALTPFEAKYVASGQQVWQLAFDAN